MFFLYPGTPVTPEERERPRPIARDSRLFQRMFEAESHGGGAATARSSAG